MQEARLRKVLDSVIEANEELVRGWMAGAPKTWGPLAGVAVGAVRRSLGRDLTESERRAVWSAMWRRLEEIKAKDLA